MQSAGTNSSLVTRAIIGFAAVQLVVSGCVHAYWLSTFSEHVLRVYFDYVGVLVFLAFASVQLILTIWVFREFRFEQPLGMAWGYLLGASVCLFLGTMLTHLLAVRTALNPLMYTSASSDRLRTLLGNIGTVLGGTVYMILLGAGLYLALRVYKQLGLLAKLKAVDLVLIGASMLYAIIVLIGVVQAIRRDPAGVTIDHALTWPGDYITCVLLIEAIFLRRSAAEMGWGYVSKVWGAFVTGIFLMSFCSLMNWLSAYGVLTWIQASFSWYLWYPVSAAFALAPAYQWEAVRTAQRRLAKRVSELSLPA